MAFSPRLLIAQRGHLATLLTSTLLLAGPSMAQAAADAGLRPIREALHVEDNACFDAETLAKAVALQLKRARVDRRLELEVRGDPQAEPGTSIEVRHAGRSAGTRTFPPIAAACDEVLSAVAVAVAMTIDATEHAPAPAESEPASDGAGVTATRQQKPQGAASESPRRHERAQVGLDVMSLWGVLPGWTAGIAPNAAYLVLPNWAVRASVFATTRGTLELNGGEVDMRALAARFDVCGALQPHGVRWRACAGVTLGRLSAVGQGFTRATANGGQQRLLLGGLVRLDARLTLVGDLGLTAFADLFVRFTDSDVSVSGGETRPMAPIGALFGAGPELRFW
jgi:hypothetical protein